MSELLDRHRRVLPSWLRLFYEDPIEIVSGSGCTVVDSEGRTYLDFFGGILTTLTGHSVPEVVDAIRSQAGRVLHTSTLYLIRPMVELAEKISGLSGIDDAKVFFVNSGSEANDTALMLCCGARRSNTVIAVRNSYHGRSFAAMAATGIRGWSASSLTPVNVVYVHGGYRYRSPFRDLDDAGYIEACADDLRDMVETATAGDVACMIAEPIQGVAGFAVPPDGLFAAWRKVLDEYGILLISDEVQTGWGRTGEHFWGYQAHDVRPDMLTFAKGVGNGLAIAGIVGRSDLIDSVSVNSISTFGGNPLACAGALANLEFLLSHDLQSNALARGEQLLSALAPLEERIASVGEVRGRGLMIAVEMVRPGGREPWPEGASAVMEETRRRGLLIGRGGVHANVLRIAPPLSVSAAETARAAGALVEALTEVDASAAR